MNEKLFYEDAKKSKYFFGTVTVLFYIGAVVGSGLMIIFSSISQNFLAHYEPGVEQIFMIVLCWGLAIFFTIFLLNAKRFKYYIEITVNEIIIFNDGKLLKYKTTDLKSYAIVKAKLRLSEFKLLLNNAEIFITTKQEQNLRSALDKIIGKNATEA